MSLRVVALRRFFPEDLEYLRRLLAPGIELVAPAEQTPEALAREAATADVLLGGAVTEPVLAAARRLKLLQVPWTGVDTLDFALLRRYRVTVCNSHSNAAAVAEFGVSLLLALLKGIPLHDRRLREGDWLRPRRDGSGDFRPPRMLAGRAVGFIGFGAIARAAAGLMAPFGTRLRAVASRRRDPAPAPLESLGDASAAPELAAWADVLFLAAPLTPKSRGLLGAALIGRMKPGAVVVNVSRGGLVDEGALYAALRDGRLGGAAIDTWQTHPSEDRPVVLPSPFPFHELPNVVLSPHRAGFSEGDLPHLAEAAENINRLAKGEPLSSVVDLEAGY